MTERQIVLDNRFENGFAVKPQTDGNDDIIGYLTCDAAPSQTPTMVLAQWYCGYWTRNNPHEYDRHNILNGTCERTGEVYEWKDASKRLRLDRSDGSIELELNASREYVRDRVYGEPWPHILVEYTTELVPICKAKRIELYMDYCLEKAECHMHTEDLTLHTAQFVWYAILKNVNPVRRDYGKYIWFGCTLYDSRFEQMPRSADIDGGKEVNTGMLIYKPASSEYLGGRPTIGKEMHVQYDMTHALADAYAEAYRHGQFTDTQYEDLAITGGNMGWEVTGTYDVCMRVRKMALTIADE